MRLLGFLACCLLSACLAGPAGPKPTIIEVPAPQRPVAELLAAIGEHSIDPVVAEGRDITVRRSDLIRLLILQNGKRALKDLIRRELVVAEIRRQDITIEATEITKAAREFLLSRNQSLETYLEDRGIGRATLVNEISIRLGAEALCRRELLTRGAARLEVTVTHEDGHSTVLSGWYGDFMLDPNIREMVFGTVPAAPVKREGGQVTFKILDRIEATEPSSRFWGERLKILQGWAPSRPQLEAYLDHLVGIHDVETLTDRLYRALETDQEGS